MNVTKGFRRVPQFEDAYRDLFKHELHKLPNRNMIALFDSFDNVIVVVGAAKGNFGLMAVYYTHLTLPTIYSV